MPRYWLCLLSFALPVMAFAAAPSQEFWEYMADYSDENGEVVDPLELDEAIAAKEQDLYEKEASIRVESEKPALELGRVKSADLKAITRSSAATSSRKGATL